MFLRLLKMILILLIVPVLHIGLLILIGIANYHTPHGVFLHWLWTLGEVLFFPYAARHGYYPSQFEFYHIAPLEYLLAIGFLMLCWIISAFITALILRRLRPFSRVKLLVFSIFIILCLVGAVVTRIAMSPLALPETAIITVDTSQSLGDLTPHHRGFSQGGEGQMTQAGYFEQAMSIMEEIRPRYIRIDHLYDYYNVLSFDDNGEAVYDFSELDRIVDAIIDADAQPLMSLSYAPPVMNPESVYTRPNDLAVWGELVYETVYYYNVERGLNIQYWEVWNEPNLSKFWAATIQDYLEMYHVTAQAVKRADESALVGGPATSSGAYGLPIFYRFSEESWFTGLIHYIQQNNLPLDFVSWHRYTTATNVYIDDIVVHEQWLNGLNPKPEMLLTEWNYTGGGSSAMDTGQTTAYLAQTLAILMDSNVDQAFYFEPIDGGKDWIGRWGLIRADGTRKPAFYAFTLFDRLLDTRLFAESNHPNIGALATRSDETTAILVWNNTALDETITLTIKGLAMDSATVELYGVDSYYGNSYFDDATTDTWIESFSLQASEIKVEIPAYGIRLLEIKS